MPQSERLPSHRGHPPTRVDELRRTSDTLMPCRRRGIRSKHCRIGIPPYKAPYCRSRSMLKSEQRKSAYRMRYFRAPSHQAAAGIMVKESMLNPAEIVHSQMVLRPSGRPPDPPPDLDPTQQVVQKPMSFLETKPERQTIFVETYTFPCFRRTHVAIIVS